MRLTTTGRFWLIYLAACVAAAAWVSFWLLSDSVAQPQSCLTDWECEVMFGPEVEVDL